MVNYIEGGTTLLFSTFDKINSYGDTVFKHGSYGILGHNGDHRGQRQKPPSRM